LQLPDEFAREIEGTYDNVRVEDITGDGVGEFIFSTEASASNSCSKVLRYNAIERSLTEIVFPIGPLCNFDARHGYIVSAYREGGAWREDIYHVSGARIKAALSDVCVGCGEVRRKKYAEDGSNIRLLVSDNVDFKERIELTAKVISSRAYIYRSPEEAQPTKKILGAWR
jgi:hypothetical protein